MNNNFNNKSTKQSRALSGILLMLTAHSIFFGEINNSLASARFSSFYCFKASSLKPRTILRFIEGSLEVKLPTIWTDEKQSREEAERRGRLEERRVEEKE
jgi:hypothetical protein